jgi:uncharacterized integral membrane protein (TIGR00697 family)
MFKLTKSFKLNLLLALFTAVVIAVNLAGAKTTTIFGNINFSMGLVLFPLTFFIMDAVSEVYGKKKSREFMWVTLISQALVLVFILFAVNVPPSARFGPSNDAYVATFGTSIRIILASLTAYFLSQLGEIFSFFFIKERTKEKYLWLRSDLSTTIGQAIDTFAFMFLAFYMITPTYDFWFVFSIAWPYYLLKLLLAYIGTPVVYLLVWWLKKGDEEEDVV